MKILNSLTGFLVGLGIAIVVFITTMPAQSAEPQKQQIPLVTAYQDGRVVAAQALPIADSVEACIAELKEFTSSVTPKPGIVLLAGCIEAPPVPVAAHTGATTS